MKFLLVSRNVSKKKPHTHTILREQMSAIPHFTLWVKINSSVHTMYGDFRNLRSRYCNRNSVKTDWSLQNFREGSEKFTWSQFTLKLFCNTISSRNFILTIFSKSCRLVSISRNITFFTVLKFLFFSCGYIYKHILQFCRQIG